jgi:hypothetical protein
MQIKSLNKGEMMDHIKLKNYGKSLLQMMNSIPMEILEETFPIKDNILAHKYGLYESGEYELFVKNEKDRMLQYGFSDIKQFGINDDAFLHQLVDWGALYNKLSKELNSGTAHKILSEVASTMWPILFSEMYPSNNELLRSSDPFAAFKKWFLEMMRANHDQNLLFSKTIEDSKYSFQINCTWCAWCETFKILGVPKACLPFCDVDDVFLPEYCKELGFKYRRSNKLADGGLYCDYRFYLE